jgi:hypothetical protein
MSDKYPHLSPYAYCANNPVKYIDPNGMEIWVSDDGNGKYTVQGGVQNKDRNIYTVDKNGKRTDKTIGVAMTEHSFFNDEGKAVAGAVIDKNDNSGKEFIKQLTSGDVGLGEYIDNAQRNQKYDFKTNGMDNIQEGMKPEQYMNRGMPTGTDKAGNTIYGSARDVGNFAAGYMAGSNFIPWSATRLAFDALETKQKGHPALEGMPSQAAQRLGHDVGWNVSTINAARKILPSGVKKAIKNFLK